MIRIFNIKYVSDQQFDYEQLENPKDQKSKCLTDLPWLRFLDRIALVVTRPL